jgi:hypothetical protein
MGEPDFFTVEEAARVLRIGRTAAYEATQLWRATGGAEGLPVVKIGGALRVPRHQLEKLAGGPINRPSDDAPAPTTSMTERRSRKQRKSQGRPGQGSLPFSA